MIKFPFGIRLIRTKSLLF